ncbi:protein-tyrosine kinase [uncultured Alistipes sp.]|uniref:protein-tyrosine kinase n=1 Tax=uncultured Alistipes sp. TaxID=538949 RepID=UPI002627CEAA|nr:protein-tyrosine kinase [uncultured Alistipes sp.]
MKMTTQPITIENGRVILRPTSGGVWLTQHQIADLFGVFVSAVGANIRSIRKSGVLCEDAACRMKCYKDGSSIEVYSLEMITALAFRLDSREASIFRRWIIERATTPEIVWRMPTSKNRMLN